MTSLKPIPEFFLREALDVWQEKRRKRLLLIMEKLQELGEVEEKKFIAWLCVFMGVHRKTAKEYINSLLDLDVITLKEEKILWIGGDENESRSCKI
ncbi:hypothetical protein J7L60_01640 [Candidatus Bathyarchaeota archaeon]|nr:hypothetical protein [Candidatus Bathyarchaeota archaeon]